jgi:hypothetical protein
VVSIDAQWSSCSENTGGVAEFWVFGVIPAKTLQKDRLNAVFTCSQACLFLIWLDFEHFFLWVFERF